MPEPALLTLCGTVCLRMFAAAVSQVTVAAGRDGHPALADRCLGRPGRPRPSLFTLLDGCLEYGGYVEDAPAG